MSPTLNVGDTYSVVSVDSFFLNQIAAFHPLEKMRYENPDVIYVSRLVGLPGDSLEMKSGRLLYNGKNYPFEVDLKHSYEIETSMTLNEERLKGMDYQQISPYKGSFYYTFFSTPAEIQTLKKNKVVLSIRPLLDTMPINDSSFPVPFAGRSSDTWGPLQVPRKGDSIVVTEENAEGLSLLITEHEKGTLPAVGEKYVFKKNYYFVISDNRHNALDSRFLGFIPEDQMVGVMYKE